MSDKISDKMSDKQNQAIKTGDKQTISKQLAKCPFCGGKARMLKKLIERKDDVTIEFGVMCYQCGCINEGYRNRELAIKKWNTRKPIERILERLEKQLALEDDLYDEMSSGAHSAYSHAIKIVKKEGMIE